MEKKIINITNSIWSKKIYRNVTIGQLISICISILINLIISILLAIYSNIIWTLVISLIVFIALIVLNVKQCFVMKILLLCIKWIFSKRTRITKQINFSNGIIKTNKKQFLFFEINCSQQIGNQNEIERKILDVVQKISKFQNWSIINTQLPFSDLNDNLNWIKSQKEKYLFKNQKSINDPILKNIVTNEYLINKFDCGEIAKNTFLFCLETDKDARIDLIIKDINYLNKSLNYQNFEMKFISDQVIFDVNENLFLFNKKITNKVNFLLAEDQENNKQYYHFFKITDLPNIVEEGYLDFLNSIELKNAIANFSINTYSFENYKKESKIWENAIKNVEYELERAIRYIDKIQAENNWDAILEINEDIVNNFDITQKFEIIVQIIAENKKDLLKAIYRIKEIVRKANQFQIGISQFNQMNLFYSFQRNILDSNNFKKNTLKILPNNLIALSYPFLIGNNYLNSGWYTGTLFNGNPIFLNLNEGEKKNNSSLIVGKTGSGKSTFINFLIKNNMSTSNIKTILFDPKGEYYLNSEIQKMNPNIISLNQDSEFSLNPFELCKNDSSIEKIHFMLDFFTIWFNDLWNDILKNQVINALKLCLENDKWNFDTFYEKILAKIPFETPNRKTIIDIFKKLTKNGLFNSFSKNTKINLDSKLNIFDLNQILINFNEINKIKLMLIFKYLKSYIYDKDNLKETKEKIQIIVDEFPAIANSNAPFVVEEFVSLIRLIRSYDASLILTMQDIVRLTQGDINSNESLKSVANNVEHKFLMNMNSEQLEIMKNIWGDSVELSKEEEYQITTKFTYGDILYLNKANRYYFNATDPNSKWSYFDQNEINDYFNKFINLNIDNKKQLKTKCKKE